jgi:hypothetical protein
MTCICSGIFILFYFCKDVLWNMHIFDFIILFVQAFFTTQYVEAHPEDAVLVNKLKDLIASQIPLLDLCIQIHRRRAPTSLIPFQQRIEECFAQMQNHVESKYGKKVIAAYINTCCWKSASVEYIQFSRCVHFFVILCTS